MRKVLKLSFALLVMLPQVFTACKSSGNDDKKPIPAKPLQLPSKSDGYIVTPKLLSQEIEVPGSLLPFEETEIRPEVSGRVTGIYFTEGSTIAQGGMIVKLYDGDLQAQLQKLQVQLKVAEQTAARYEALLKINGVSQQEYDLNVLAVNNIKADINIIRTSISKTSVRAPFSGKMGLRNISVGAYISPQTTISTLRQVNQLKLEFTVPEKYGSGMKNGNLVNFTLENNRSPYSAKVIATENNITENSRSLKVKAVVSKPDAQLIAGSFAKVLIPLGKNDSALMIPTQAVIPQARIKQVIALKNGQATMVTITTGTRDSAMVEITSGLKSGDTVLITGLLTTKPGSTVLLNKLIKN